MIEGQEMIRDSLTALLLLAIAFPGAQAAAIRKELRGMEAVKFLYQRRDYAQAKLAAYTVLWKDINQPEALYYLAGSLARLNDRKQAAVFYTLLLRVLEEDPKSKADRRAASWKATCLRALKALDGRHRAEQKTYAQTASGKTFAAPDKVSDLWMSQVKCTLHCLHGLYAWKLVGGRKDAKPDWIHNTQGAMHRSGAKYMADIHGRSGVLFCIPNKKSRLLSTLVWDGPAKGKVLRIGTMAYNFPYLLNVLVGEKQVFSKTIGKDSWDDLRIPLDTEVGKGTPLTLELVVPENQRWHEGLFFDYIDFFEG